MKKTLISLAMTAMFGMLTATASAGVVYEDITVKESGLIGPTGSATNTGQYIVDRITGGYTENFQPLVGNTFQSAAFFNVGQYYANEGASLMPGGGGANKTSVGFSYGVYGIFYSNGSFTGNPLTGVNFSGGTGEIKLYIDAMNDTVLGVTAGSGANGSITRSLFTDDYELGSTSLLYSGLGSTLPGGVGIPNGNFDLVFTDVTLTTDGAKYWTAPLNFKLDMDVTGQLISFNPLVTTTITGSADAFFFNQVPEPGSLALLGLGLAGLGFAKRRRS